MFIEISTWLISLIFMLLLFRLAYSVILECYTVLVYYQDQIRLKEINFLHKKFGSNTSFEFRKNIMKIARIRNVEMEVKNGILASHQLIEEKKVLADVE